MALAHVRVDHHHLLPHLGEHRRQVGGDERLTHLRTGAGDHHHFVGGFHHGEVEAGAQAPKGFDGKVGRVIHRQQRDRFVLGAFAAAHHRHQAVQFLLMFGERDGGVDRDALLFQLVRGFDTTVQQARTEDVASGEH